tara:strand:- start:1007 stop:2167 length:1161 start_codon:yes stop_codon:yes gene_type:complete
MIPAGGDEEFYRNYAKEEAYYSSQVYKDKVKSGDPNPYLPTKKRKLPHPKVLSYPVAVTPDESNGTRLLIKCFEYIPPKTSTNVGFSLLKNDTKKTLKIDGVKYPPGSNLKNKDGSYRLAESNVKLDNQGASDKIGQQKMSHLYYVELPIPQDVNDSNTVTWGDNSLNIFQLAGLQVASRGIENLGEGFAEAKALLTSAISQESGLPENTRKAVAAAIAGKAIDPQGQNIRPNTAIARATGQILNSNLELLFDSVNLRTFPFNVTFSPRNPTESMRVKHIIRAFKSSMAAKKGTNETGQGGIFLKSPDVFQLRYLHNGDDHPFLNSFKHCALTGMTVNYTNAGTFASYEDGTPVSIQMSLTFKELNPIYQEDYNMFSSNDNLGVGY